MDVAAGPETGTGGGTGAAPGPASGASPETRGAARDSAADHSRTTPSSNARATPTSSARATPTSGRRLTPSTPMRAAPADATLSRELGDFLVELSIAFHKHAIYPPGHPLLRAAVDSVSARVWGLLTNRTALSIGVARRQLIIEGVATDANHPLLQELASKLHRHHLGAVKLMAGITRDELADALATMAVDAGRMERPLGLDAAEVSARWAHVKVFPLTYEKLELLDEKDADDEKTVTAEGQMRAGRAAQLWVGLARAALVADAGAGAAELPHDQGLEPVAVAKAIDEHQREVAYDQVIVGYLLQIADELKTAKGAETVALQRRISGLVGALQPETLQRLMDMSGDNRQRRQFVLDASQGMTVEAVVELVKAAADAEKQTISHSLVRMFSKLAKHAGDADTRRRTLADQSLREQVERLIREWSLDDPNPEAYRMVLEEISRRGPAEATPSPFSLNCEPDRVVKMGLEVGVVGTRVERAVTTMLESHQVAALLDLVDGAPDPAVGSQVWREIEDRDVLRTVLEEERIDYVLVARLVQRMRLAAIMPLLDAIESREEGKARDRLMDLLVSIGADAGPYIASRMRTAPAALQRDCLVALGRLDGLPAGMEPGAYLMHPEPIVRREAVRLFLRVPETREQTMVAALSDPDDRTVFQALSAAQEGCPEEGVAIIRQRVDDDELDGSLRALGIRIVGGSRHDPATRDWLLRLVVGRTKWLRRKKLLHATPEMLAALGALAAFWKDSPEAEDAVNMARRSKDAEVRHAVAQQRVTGPMRAVSG